MLANFPSTNGYLTTLDFGHVSGVPVFGGSPQSLAGHPQAFYEGSQRPLGLRSCGGLVWLYVASRLLFAIISAHIGISLHISALVCIHQH